MKIVIERAKCVGHARCNVVAGALYPVDENGLVETDGFEVPEGQEKLATRGARACPERIIHVVQEES